MLCESFLFFREDHGDNLVAEKRKKKTPGKSLRTTGVGSQHQNMYQFYMFISLVWAATRWKLPLINVCQLCDLYPFASSCAGEFDSCDLPSHFMFLYAHPLVYRHTVSKHCFSSALSYRFRRGMDPMIFYSLLGCVSGGICYLAGTYVVGAMYSMIWRRESEQLIQVSGLMSARLCVCAHARARMCVCHNEKRGARRMASTTSDTGDTSSKQQQAQRKENYNKSKRPVSSVDHCHPYRRKKRREAVY